MMAGPALLQQLLRMTLDFPVRLLAPALRMWRQLAREPQNTRPIVQYLLTSMDQLGEQHLHVCQEVAVFCSSPHTVAAMAEELSLSVHVNAASARAKVSCSAFVAASAART